MPLLLLVFLALVCLPDIDRYQQPAGVSLPVAALLSLGVVALPVLAAWLLTRRTIGQLRRSPEMAIRILRRHDRVRGWQNLALFACYVLSLWVCGWGWVVREVWSSDGHLWPVPEALLLLPLFTAMTLSWAIWFDTDRVAHLMLNPHQPLEEAPAIFTRRGAYVMFHVRAKLGMVLIPVSVLVLQKEFRSTGPESEDWSQTLGLFGMLLILPLLPLLVRLILGLERMPDGLLRQRLESVARRLGFRCSDLLIWNTRGGMANAMVLGVLPWPRYVVFTDRMLTEFLPEEIEAVFGHEIGHVKHQHLLYYMGFLAASMMVLGLGVPRLLSNLTDLGLLSRPGENEAGGWFNQQLLEALPLVACLVAYVFIVFGYLSRRCERQADIYGCRAVSCGDPECANHDPENLPVASFPALCPTGIRIFVRALEKVAYVNGISKDRPGFLQSWQHSTIALRMAFLLDLMREPELEPRFQQRVRWVKVGLLLLLGLALVLLLGTQGRAG